MSADVHDGPQALAFDGIEGGGPVRRSAALHRAVGVVTPPAMT
jgi:hypothetical protein